MKGFVVGGKGFDCRILRERGGEGRGGKVLLPFPGFVPGGVFWWKIEVWRRSRSSWVG